MWFADLHDQVTGVQRGQAMSGCRTGGIILDVQVDVVVWQESEAVRDVAASRLKSRAVPGLFHQSGSNLKL